MSGSNGNGNGDDRGDYGVALAFTAIGARLWELARLLDATSNPRRLLLIARTETELAELTVTIADTRRVVAKMKEGP